jgi:hypothetical protein
MNESKFASIETPIPLFESLLFRHLHIPPTSLSKILKHKKMTTRQFILGQILVSIITVGLLFLTSCDSESSPTTNTQEKKAEIKKPSMDLHSAVFLGNMNALKEHIAYGTDLNSKDAYGSTALNIACTFGKTDIALELINAKADLNARNADGGTALHTAAFFCRPEILKALLEAGADKTIRNQYQSTALESVMAPFEEIKPIYEEIAKNLGPMGLRMDFDRIEKTRPEIAKLLQ